ncbi:hypothetical protein LBMAG48_07930 [Phycisphaerae bacterium]|nr:hypothetical protein LBMAG48_07930 [Phycisphaerae bacterium]
MLLVSHRDLAARTLALTLVACAGACTGQAFAQDRKHLPPEPVRDADPATQRLANIDGFRDAYTRAGSPRLLITVDSDAIGRNASTSRDIAQRLGLRLEDLFGDPEVTIINPAAAQLREDRQREALARNDEFAASRMLGADTNADMVLLVRLGDRAGDGYRASYTLTDLRQGTTLGRFSWDMTPDPQTGQFDNYRVSEYAQSIGRRVAKQFSEAFPLNASGTLTRYNLRIVGEYEDDDLSALRDALNNSSGVRQGSVRVRSQEQSTADQLTTLDMFATGDMLTVRTALRSAARDQLCMSAEVLDGRDMSLTVRLTPLAMDTRQRALAGGPTTSRNSGERATLAERYAKAGKPTIAVLVNRATVDLPETRVSTGSDAANPLQTGDGTNIIIGERVGLGASRIDPILGDIVRDELTDRRAERLEQGEVDLRQVENRLIERLGSLGFNLKDAAAAQAQLRSAGTLDAKAWTDREFAATLASEAKADIVISGVARVVRTRGGGLPLTIEVTLRAVRTSDNAILGAASSQKTVTVAGTTLTQALDDLTAEATGKLVAGMSDAWARP